MNSQPTRHAYQKQYGMPLCFAMFWHALMWPGKYSVHGSLGKLSRLCLNDVCHVCHREVQCKHTTILPGQTIATISLCTTTNYLVETKMAAAKSPLYEGSFKVGHLELVSTFTVRNYIQKDSANLLHIENTLKIRLIFLPPHMINESPWKKLWFIFVIFTTKHMTRVLEKTCV